MTATATIVLESKTGVLTLPSSDVISRGDRHMVRVKKDGKITPTRVEIGMVTDTMTEITSGLEEGDQVVSTSSFTTTNTNSGQRNSSNTFSLPGVGGGAFRPRD